MRVFVCEFLTGGGLGGSPLPAGLCREGDIMLRALLEDLSGLPGVDVLTTRDRRQTAVPRVSVRWIGARDDPWATWSDLIARSDATWPIAPETGGALERISDLIVTLGCTLLGSRPAALCVTTSKRRTAAHLAAHGVPVAVTVPFVEALAGALPQSVRGWVVKPDVGAGAEDTHWLRRAADLRRWAATRTDAGRFVVQPYLHGAATSLSLLCRDGSATLLACNSQDVRIEGDRFRYCGGVVCGREARRAAYEPIAARVAAALPDLWGHAGIDLVDTPRGPVVLEVNARLTTSYAGLRDALDVNPAALALRLLAQELPASAPRVVRERAIALDADAA